MFAALQILMNMTWGWLLGACFYAGDGDGKGQLFWQFGPSCYSPQVALPSQPLRMDFQGFGGEKIAEPPNLRKDSNIQTMVNK